jgi:hypothetical protein
MQNYDQYTYRVLSMIVRNFNRILLFGAVRETFLEQPLFQDPTKPTQEQIFSEGLQELEAYGKDKDDENLVFEGHEIKGLKMDDLWEVIKHNFKID